PTQPPPTQPPPTQPPPTDPPPPDPPPTPEPPAVPEDVKLVLGQAFEVPDKATGEVAFTIMVDAITADIACSAAGSSAAENGHLVGLHVTVTTGPAPVGGATPPAIGPSDFELLGTDAPAADTASAAACMTDADSFPSGPLGPEQEVAGTIVLDVPDVAGTVAYRPDAWFTSLLWGF
ncbi:MAG: hypothetical protein JWQ99_1305, partial [Blastococcus sp.]|nr:hypothetical protein [Blastococcus sp.]